ncbi:MAG: hypothetical protein ACKO69_01025 [Limnohabitans sp.]
MRCTAAGPAAMGLMLWLTGCSHLKPQATGNYAVDTQTAWHTIALTPDGTYYGVDTQGVSRNGPFRTVWLQKRSANSPYLYEQWQISVHCAARQWMWLLRTVVENNQVTAMQHDVTLGWDGMLLKKPQTLTWLPIHADSKEETVMRLVCVNSR